MKKQIIVAADAPRALGTYSQAIKVGDMVFLSGQLGIHAQTGELAQDFAAQSQQMFKNLQAVARAAGGELRDIVKLTVFVTDLNYFQQFNDIMAEYFTGNYPARAVVQVAALPKAALVEADAIMHCATQE